MELLILEIVGMGIMITMNFLVVKYQNHLFFKSLDERLKRLEEKKGEGREGDFFHKA